MGYIGSDPKTKESVSTSQLIDDSVTNAKIVDDIQFNSVTSSVVSASSNIIADTFSGTFSGALSSSAQIGASISGSFTSPSASLSTRVTAVEAGSTSKTLVSSSVLSSPSQGTIRLATNGVNTDVDSGLQSSDSPTFAGVTVTGTLTAQEIHTEFESASILFTSGSTHFGNSSDDVHEMTGSLNISGSLTLKDGNFTVTDDFSVDGTTNLDNTDIDGTLTVDGGNIVFNEDSADQDFRVESNGNANMLFVDGGQNAVGIGTNNAGASSEKLLIVGNDNQNFLVVSSSNDDNFISIGTFENDQAVIGFGNKATTRNLNFYAANRPVIGGSSLVMSLSGSGHVIVPQGPLEVGQHGIAGGQIVSDGDLAIHAGFNDSSTGNGDIIFKRFGESTSAVELARVTSTGNVGIGTNSPQNESSGVLLHIADTGGSNAAHINLSGGDGADGSQTGKISFSDPGDPDDAVAFISSNIAGSNANPGGTLHFFTAADGGSMTEKVRIGSDGQIESPTDGHYSLYPYSNNTSFTTYGFRGDQNTGMYRLAADTLGFATGATNRLTILSDGTIFQGTNGSNLSKNSAHAFNVAAAYPWISNFAYNGYPAFQMYRSNNSTVGSHTATADSDIIGVMNWYGSTASAHKLAASIDVRQSGSMGTYYTPTRMDFYAAYDDENFGVAAPVFSITGPGFEDKRLMGVGTKVPTSKFHVENATNRSVRYVGLIKNYGDASGGPINIIKCIVPRDANGLGYSIVFNLNVTAQVGQGANHASIRTSNVSVALARAGANSGTDGTDTASSVVVDTSAYSEVGSAGSSGGLAITTSNSGATSGTQTVYIRAAISGDGSTGAYILVSGWASGHDEITFSSA